MNKEIALAFDRIANLLEITGADAFRVNTYRRVARILNDLRDDVRWLIEAGKLQEIKGVGKGTAAKIEQYIETGTVDLLEELQAKVPEGLLDLLAVPGMGPKKVALVHKELNVKNLEDLKQVAEDGELEKLPGMGKQSAKKIIEGIAFLATAGDRVPLGQAWNVAAPLAEFLREREDVARVVIAGSARRGRETVGDMDLLCESDGGKEVVQAFTGHPSVKKVLADGATKGSVLVDVGRGRQIQVDLRVVPSESFGAAMQYFTGSKEHNVRLREMAIKRGWKLNEWGLFEGEERVAGADEAEIYAKLDLPWIPAEVREDRREFEAEREAFDALISLDHIRGDLHMHTTASDGKNSILEMAEAARARGLEYIAITDHSRSSTIAGGLSIEALLEHMAAIRKVDAEIEGIRVFAGVECDILTDGALDYPDEILAQCDVVVASIHSAMEKGKATPTERTLAALENPHVTIIGHPTGRLIHRRPAMELDMDVVLDAAAKSGSAMEISASWQRLDLKAEHAQLAMEKDVMVAINTDAHATAQLGLMHFGVTTARRGWVRHTNCLNALPLAVFEQRLQKKRS